MGTHLAGGRLPSFAASARARGRVKKKKKKDMLVAVCLSELFVIFFSDITIYFVFYPTTPFALIIAE